jgi:hypothetical protein
MKTSHILLGAGALAALYLLSRKKPSGTYLQPAVQVPGTEEPILVNTPEGDQILIYPTDITGSIAPVASITTGNNNPFTRR